MGAFLFKKIASAKRALAYVKKKEFISPYVHPF